MALYLPEIQLTTAITLCALFSSEITSSDEPDCLLLMQKIFDTLGKTRNYSPSIQEAEEGDRRKAEEKIRREAQERAEEEQREVEEARHRAARWEEWVGAERRAQHWM